MIGKNTVTRCVAFAPVSDRHQYNNDPYAHCPAVSIAIAKSNQHCKGFYCQLLLHIKNGKNIDIELPGYLMSPDDHENVIRS